MLHLTGNPSPDLMGRRIRFECRSTNPAVVTNDEETQLANLAWQQVGPTGEMTAVRKIPQADGDKSCLYLEWLSQNGRVVIELVDPVIEFVDHDEVDDDDDDEDDADWGLNFGSNQTDNELDRAIDNALDSLSEDELDDDLDDDELDDLEDELDDDFVDEYDDEPEDDDDPYGLLPPNLHEHFEQEAWNTDRALDSEHSGDEEDSNTTIRELRLMDDLIEKGEGDLIRTIFDRPLAFPLPEKISNAEAEQKLKELLAELALFGIALDVCEHYTPRDAYRLLLEEICPQQRAYPELRNTQWVQHFMTSEYCSECAAEIERELSDTDQAEDDE